MNSFVKTSFQTRLGIRQNISFLMLLGAGMGQIEEIYQ
jgi:hypothetical protein